MSSPSMYYNIPPPLSAPSLSPPTLSPPPPHEVGEDEGETTDVSEAQLIESGISPDVFGETRVGLCMCFSLIFIHS